MGMENEIKKSRRPMIVKVSDELAWYVSSESHPDEMYKTTLHSCECKAWQYRGNYCKHMGRVMDMLTKNITALLSDSEDKTLLVRLLEESIKIIQERKQEV